MPDKWVVTVDPESGKYCRVNLAECEDLDIRVRRWSTGIQLEGAYLLKRMGYVILHTYSVWAKGTAGDIVGDQYHVASTGEISKLLEYIDSPAVMELLPKM